MNENLIIALNFILLVLLGVPLAFKYLAIICYPLSVIVAILYFKLLSGKHQLNEGSKKNKRRRW